MTKKLIMKDLWLAAAVSQQTGIKPSLTINNGLVLFTFPSSDDVQDAVSGYYNGSVLSAIGYSEELKRLRARMYAARARG